VLYPSAQVAATLLETVGSEDLSGSVLSSSIRRTAGTPPVDETPMLAEARSRLGL
jgi:hypothetical protein